MGIVKKLTQCKKFVPLLTIPCTLRQGIRNCTGPLMKQSVPALKFVRQSSHQSMLNFFSLKHAIEICKIIKESSFVVEPLQGVQLMHPWKGKHVCKESIQTIRRKRVWAQNEHNQEDQ